MTRNEVLEVMSGRDVGARFALADGAARIGRDPAESDIVLTDPRVSRRHARLWVEGGLLMLEDAGSTGGTRVNGTAIGRATALRVGDRLTLGATEMEVLWVPQAAATMIGEIPADLLDPVPPPTVAVPPPPPPPPPPPAPVVEPPMPEPEPVVEVPMPPAPEPVVEAPMPEPEPLAPVAEAPMPEPEPLPADEPVEDPQEPVAEPVAEQSGSSPAASDAPVEEHPAPSDPAGIISEPALAPPPPPPAGGETALAAPIPPPPPPVAPAQAGPPPPPPPPPPVAPGVSEVWAPPAPPEKKGFFRKLRGG